MFRKAFQVVVTFSLLTAGYAAYTRGFALLLTSLTPAADPTLTHKASESRTMRQAIDLAVRAFGPGHFSTQEDLQIRIYNSERGVWMYARDYERINEGKTLLFRPFAAIWASRDGKVLKTVLSDEARIDLDQPLGLLGKPGQGALRVVHARITGNVMLRDDKGTTDPDDDTRITGLTYVDFDDATLLVTGDDNDTVEIVDRDLRITGQGLLIRLRPRPTVAGPPGTPAPSAGFDGAETAYLKRKADIYIADVGRQGILPGASEPTQRQGEKTPLRLRADGDGTLTRPAMQIDLPRPHLPVKVGPPAPSGPTLAKFYRNVEVLRGKPTADPDRLDCDELRLTLVPADRGGPSKAEVRAAEAPTETAQAKEKVATKAAEPPSQGGPLTDLVLKRAEASGHNLQIASAAQGVRARCNELIHKKNLPDAPDETYFRGDVTPVVVEKTDLIAEGPDKGKVSSFTTIRTVDATLFDDGRGNDNATIVARGPGELETRPDRGKPVERTARWSDQLVFQNDPNVKGLAPAPAPAPARPGAVAAAPPTGKRITLTGKPSFADAPSRTTLSAARALVVKLRPKLDAAIAPAAGRVAGAAGAASPPKSQAFEIDRLVAQQDVLLTAPGKTLVAREYLDADFEPAPGGLSAPRVTTSDGPAATTPAPGAPATKAITPAAPNATPNPEAPPAQPAPPTDPSARAEARRVWARIQLRPSTPANSSGAGAAGSAPRPAGSSLLGGTGGAGGHDAEVAEVRLRGDVKVHQDPAPGKTKGTEVRGEAVDVVNRGQGALKFVVYHSENPGAAASQDPFRPTATTPPADAAHGPSGGEPARVAPLARIETDEMTVTGEVIGMDQASDLAWSQGRGDLTVMTTRGLLSDKGLANPLPAPGDRPAPPPAPAGNGAAIPVRPASAVVELMPDRSLTRVGGPGAIDPPPAPPASAVPVKKVPLTIRWTGGMKFFGRSANLAGQPVARAEFYDDVHADMEDASLACKDIMRVFFDRVVKLDRPPTRPDAAPAGRANANAPANANGDAPPRPAEPRPDLAVIELVEQVEVVNVKRDELDPRTVVEKQVIHGDYLIYDKASGRFRVPGKGDVTLWDRSGSKDGNGLGLPGLTGGARTIRPTAGPPPARPAAGNNANVGDANRPAAPPLPNPNPTAGAGAGRGPEVVGRNAVGGRLPAPRAAGTGAGANANANANTPAKPPWNVTQVKFRKDMLGRFGTGKETDRQETRWADFFGDVEALHGPVADVHTRLDPDRLSPDAQFIAGQVLRVISEPNRADAGATARYLLRAWDDVAVTAGDKTIRADRITFDSEKSLFYAYGDDGRDVVVAQQSGFAQGASVLQGRAAWYNQKTGAAEVVEPRALAVVDPKGERPRAVAPPKENTKPMRPKRKELRAPRINPEAKGFSGR